MKYEVIYKIKGRVITPRMDGKPEVFEAKNPREAIYFWLTKNDIKEDSTLSSEEVF